MTLCGRFAAWCNDRRQSMPLGAGSLLGRSEGTGRWRTAGASCFAGTTTRPSRPQSPPPSCIPPGLKALGPVSPIDRETVGRKSRQPAKASHPDAVGEAARFAAIEGADREASLLAGSRRP
jgi:hypothetical protein